MTEQPSFFEAARPSFARMTAAEGRVAVVDVGSNSVRLVVFEGSARAPAYFFNEKASCGLGAQIAATGRLDPDGVRRALGALRRFAALAERMRVVALDAVATAAVREAEDGPEFAAEVERQTGLKLRVIEGDEEARLAALGVLLGEPGADGAAADMGGASMELADLTLGRVGPRLTLALGPQRLAGLDAAAQRKRIDAELDRAAEMVRLKGRTLYVVGGAWRSVAKAHMARVDHPLKVLHGLRLDAEAATEAFGWIAAQSPETLKALPGVSSARAPNTPLAALLLVRMVARLQPAAVAVSAFGLREGVFFERLPEPMRRLDPLLDVCRRLESAQARFPGFGEELAAWIRPLVESWGSEDRRLAHAACLLNDVNWRAHPDYRAASCFETITRANLAGIDHRGRVFVGVALTNRYGGGRLSGDAEAAATLLDKPAAARARALGRALRLGAMISGSTPGTLSQARLDLADGEARLELSPALAALSGEMVERRLTALAEALGTRSTLAT